MSVYSKTDTLNQRIPKNPKYEHVGPVVDTGASIKKVKLISTREYLKRKDEIFKRIKPLQLYNLIIDNEERPESIYAAAADAPRVAVVDAEEDTVSSKPFLLLDIRSEEDYEKCHILEAVNYPGSWLNRDKITPELFRYKNKEDNIIVLYDGQERESPAVATAFVQKGFDNIYLLSGGELCARSTKHCRLPLCPTDTRFCCDRGSLALSVSAGLKACAAKYPLMVEGDLPEELVPSPPRTASSRAGSRVAGGSIRPETGRTGLTAASRPAPSSRR